YSRFSGSIRQTNTETSTEFMQRFLRLAGFLEAVAGTEEEQAKNFQWGLCRETRVSSPTDLPILVLSNPGVPLRFTPIQFALLVDVDTKESVVELQPGASGHVFAITEGQAANTSSTIMGTLFIYGHAVFVLFDTGATHSVI
nr:zinc finger, CCHC-type, retrotransposon Gag domain protein [Tanacetum cinerariifolium]